MLSWICDRCGEREPIPDYSSSTRYDPPEPPGGWAWIVNCPTEYDRRPTRETLLCPQCAQWVDLVVDRAVRELE